MNKSIILSASVLLMTGCMQESHVRATTVATGCSPDKVKVTKSKMDIFSGPSWTATCGNITYYCLDSVGGSVQCSKAQN